MIEIRKIHYFFAVGAGLVLLLGLLLLLRMVNQVAKSAAPPPAPVQVAPARSPEVAQLIEQTNAELQQLPADYQITPYVQAAADLQALPRGEAVDLLKFFAVTKASAKTKYLCLLLFDLQSVPGLAQPFAKRVSLIFMENVPFILQRFDDGDLPKIPDGRTFLGLCLAKAPWSTRHYAPTTPEQLRQALDQILPLKAWAVPLSADDKAALYKQADLTPGG
jgi:hypothetical protein